MNSIAIDKGNNIWMARRVCWCYHGCWQQGLGVAKFGCSNWITYTTSDGLANDYVNAIAIDAEYNKWFATDGGVSKLSEYFDSLDCNCDKNGLAFIDSCGICAGGSTGITPVLDKIACYVNPDCNGDEDGYAFIDSCGNCAGGNTGIPPVFDKIGCYVHPDCHGDEDGSAFIDSCGICAGGNTGITPVLDTNECLHTSDNSLKQPEELNQPCFRIFPNPNNGQLNIIYNGALPFQIMIVDMLGKVVLEENLNGSSTINASHLMAGYYEVIIKIRNEIIRKKLIML